MNELETKSKASSVKKLAVTQQSVPVLPPFPKHLFERAPQLYAFRLALSFQKQSGIFSRPLNAAECGVYRGYGLLALAETAKLLKYRVKFTGLDSFEGFPELSSEDIALAPKGAKYLDQSSRSFSDTNLNAVKDLFKTKSLQNSIELVPGFFSDTLKRLPERKYFFVNIDCDLYQPHRECLDYFYPRMAKNGVIFFDDYNSHDFPMAKKAIDEFVNMHGLQLIHLRHGEEKPNHTKAFIIKDPSHFPENHFKTFAKRQVAVIKRVLRPFRLRLQRILGRQNF